jgi:hypothetical protein
MNDHLGSSESQLMLSPADTTSGHVVLSGNPSWLKAWPNRAHRQSSLALHIAYIGPRSERVLVKHLAVCPIPPGIVRDSRRVMEGNDPCPKQGGSRSPQISTILMSSPGPSLMTCQQLTESSHIDVFCKTTSKLPAGLRYPTVAELRISTSSIKGWLYGDHSVDLDPKLGRSEHVNAPLDGHVSKHPKTHPELLVKLPLWTSYIRHDDRPPIARDFSLSSSSSGSNTVTDIWHNSYYQPSPTVYRPPGMSRSANRSGRSFKRLDLQAEVLDNRRGLFYTLPLITKHMAREDRHR